MLIHVENVVLSLVQKYNYTFYQFVDTLYRRKNL